MGGADSVSLIAQTAVVAQRQHMQTIHYGSPQAQSQVLAAAEAWLANSDTSDDAFDSIVGDGTMRLAHRPTSDARRARPTPCPRETR